MINEHKAHASFVLKVINVVIGCGFVLVLAVIIYDMFFHISNDLIIAYELIIVPSFSLLTYVLFGIAYKEITKLTNYDKHKLISDLLSALKGGGSHWELPRTLVAEGSSSRLRHRAGSGDPSIK
jgi:hypothetical protein